MASSPPTSVWGAGHCMYRVALFVHHITRGEAVWEVEAMDSLAPPFGVGDSTLLVVHPEGTAKALRLTSS